MHSILCIVLPVCFKICTYVAWALCLHYRHTKIWHTYMYTHAHTHAHAHTRTLTHAHTYIAVHKHAIHGIGNSQIDLATNRCPQNIPGTDSNRCRFPRTRYNIP